jgi:predicted small metal-binding protein
MLAVQPSGSRGDEMAKQITCECGFVASAETDDEVIVQIESHISTDHPDLIGKVGRDDLLGWIEET